MNVAIPILLVTTVAGGLASPSAAQETSPSKGIPRRLIDVSVEGLGQTSRRAPGSDERSGSIGSSALRTTRSTLPLDCTARITDQAASSCLTASSTPTLGMLYPYPGLNNVFTAPAFVGGGENNQATQRWSTVAGGFSNTAQGDWSTVGGGTGNTARESSTIAGGTYNGAYGFVSTIGGGGGNRVHDRFTTVAGGFNNRAYGESATIGGGIGNKVSALNATIGGGSVNQALGLGATVGGGYVNEASGDGATVGGGGGIYILAGRPYRFGNTASGRLATVGGGGDNTASGAGATVAGGGGFGGPSGTTYFGNTASGDYSAVGGGSSNAASGAFAVVPGGRENTSPGDYSFAAGSRAMANHTGAFVWADSQSSLSKASSANDEFNVYASGGVRLFTNSAATTGVLLAPGGSTWTMVSDRDAKENVEPVDARAVLDKVAELPLATWNYEAQDDSVRHMGPMAQDFHAAFGLGLGEKTIDTIDPPGVALAAIQGLNAELEALRAEKDAEIEELKARLGELTSRLDELAASR